MEILINSFILVLTLISLTITTELLYKIKKIIKKLEEKDAEDTDALRGL